MWLTRVESDGCEIRRCEGDKILGKSDVTRLCRATEQKLPLNLHDIP